MAKKTGTQSRKKTAAAKKNASPSARSPKKSPSRSKVGKKKAAPKAKKKVARKTVKKAAGKIAPKLKKTATTAAMKSTDRKAAAAAPPLPAEPVFVQWGTDRIELIDESRRVPKTKLTKRELREFQRMLHAKRKELVGDMTNLTNEALSGSANAGGQSSVPLHMADVGSDNWEQEFTLGLIENERALVREIDDALARIENRTYGVCLATHREIDKTRLRAKPWAKYCIEYARLKELGRVP